MAVQFILGANPNVKRETMINHIYQHLEEKPTAQIVYLIPDNVKYEAEMMVLEQFKKNSGQKIAGMIDLQIFSFSRLAWYLLQDKAIYQHPQLTESGLAMLLTKIIKEEEDELSIYRGASQERGFIQRLITLFSEFRNGKIHPDDLEDILQATTAENTGQDFQRKIADISHLYEKYDQALAGSYLEREDLYTELIELIETEQNLFRDVTIYVDHYEHFSAQELELLTVLAKNSKQLLISLTLTPAAVNMPEDFNNLFYRPLKTYHQLKQTFQGQGVKVLADYIIEPKQKNHDEHTDLDYLREYWVQSNDSMTYVSGEMYQNVSYEQIEIWETEDVDAEVLHLAGTIQQLVASGEYRYKDFQIMARNLENYELSVEVTFNENKIPFFIDEKESMAQHPLLEFLISLFSLKKRYYRLNDILRLLRTELLVPGVSEIEWMEEDEITVQNSLAQYEEIAKKWREQIDVTENVALAFGYEGSDWVNEEDWHYSRFHLEENDEQPEEERVMEEQANEVRAWFRTEVISFVESLDELQTNADLAEALYHFMERCGIMANLSLWRTQLIAAGQLGEAEKHEQAWETFVSLLDEFVEVLGEEPWDIDGFIAIMEAGFEEACYSMVPPTIDQVLITNYDLPKIQAKKVVFLIGLTDTELPQVQENQSLLTDEDREVVEASLTEDKYLAVSGMESMANEPFGFYLAMLQASEKIYFTYPSTDQEHKESRMSPYLTRIKEGLGLEINVKYGNAISLGDEVTDPFAYLPFLVSADHAFAQLVISLRQALDQGVQPAPFWNELFKELFDPTDNRQRLVFNSLHYKNIPVPLTEELAAELYGKDLYLSVSQLESFYTDPYSHFLIYGLRLQERPMLELTPLASGNFSHDALDLISQQLIQSERDLASLSEKEINQITKDIFQHLFRLNKYRLAHSSKRMNFIFRQLSKTVHQMIHAMVYQAKRSQFRPAKTELLFGQLGNKQGIRGLSFDLKDQRQLRLRGKIDRVDSFKKGGQLYAGVVDYKSSATTFNYQNIYHGLMLQMVTYLDTVLTFSEEVFGENALGIGAFYSTINNPFTDLQEVGTKELELKKLEQYKYKGLIVKRDEVLAAADTILEPKEISPVYPVRLLASGKYSDVETLTEEELSWLIQFNRELIVNAGNQIISGKNTLRPYDRRQAKVFTPSVDGPYRAISQFDALLKENNYQEVESMNQKQFFAFLKEKYGSKQEDHL